MTPLCLFIIHWICVTSVWGNFVEPPADYTQRTIAEEETVLPCRYQVNPGEEDVVVQVTWYKDNPDGTKDQIIAAHRTDGQTAFGSWSGRVRFRGSEPTVDSSLVIMTTELSDEGAYICHISTFPFGNFDRQLSLTVWTMPISSLDPMVLVEGQSFRLAASCRSVARPPPHLSWDTELSGMSSNRSTGTGSVSSHYSLHPLRSMNGKQLDCLVWHPALQRPRRLSNQLVVHFPPDVEVSGYNQNWHVGLEMAALRCASGGNPKPHSFTWTRKGGALPDSVIPHPNGTLAFGPLSTSDSGIYQCVAKNDVGSGTTEVEVKVSEVAERQTSFDSLLMVIVGAAAGGLLILMLVIVISVTCHHKRKNRKLAKELDLKKEEISTLSRQASFRRINSVSTDARGPTMLEEIIPLRVEGTLRTSLSSLGEQARCRDSRSTLSGGRGSGGLDYLGRPVLHNSSRRLRERALDRDEENRLRVESYVRNSTISLQETRLHPPLVPSPFPMVQSTELLRPLNGSAILPAEGLSLPANVNRNQQHSPLNCSYPPVTDDEDEEEEDEGLGDPMHPAGQGHPDDQDSETNSSQMSDALNPPRFQQTNGTLRSKARSNSAVGPHASLIHKAHIV